jgi:hypothetical protein
MLVRNRRAKYGFNAFVDLHVGDRMTPGSASTSALIAIGMPTACMASVAPVLELRSRSSQGANLAGRDDEIDTLNSLKHSQPLNLLNGYKFQLLKDCRWICATCTATRKSASQVMFPAVVPMRDNGALHNRRLAVSVAHWSHLNEIHASC